MNLVSMKCDPAEAESTAYPTPAGERELYPYGLRLTLNGEALAKLGIPLPAVGASFNLTARVECTSARADKEQGGTEIGCDLQITDMALDGGSDPAVKLWPDND